MSNLLVKLAVKYRLFSNIGIVDLDGPLIAFQCHVPVQPQCHVLLSIYCTQLISSGHIYEKQNGCDKSKMGTIGSKMGRKFEQKRKAKWAKKATLVKA